MICISLRADIVNPQTFTKWRRHPESNRGIRVLQTRALPLGYVALIVGGWWLVVRSYYSANRLIRLQPVFIEKGLKLVKSFLRLMERMTGLEPATSTLARWRSTR